MENTPVVIYMLYGPHGQGQRVGSMVSVNVVGTPEEMAKQLRDFADILEKPTTDNGTYFKRTTLED
jgi:alkanesulfonate monooxygenase SsuD/methylene tetrahydromethanopterin reductase-like flavin-dependent oxidoreductase (luciferase family)